MYRMWLLIGVVVLLLYLVGMTLFFLFRLGGGTFQSTTSEAQIGNISARQWAEDMVRKYPYIPQSHSGVTTSRLSTQVWMIGRKKTFPETPEGYLTVENTYGRFTAKLPPEVVWSVQKGDDMVSSQSILTVQKEILEGDFVAARTIYFNNSSLILEVRKLDLFSDVNTN